MNEYTYDDILIGMTESFKKRITPEMEDAFRAITGDENPLHKMMYMPCKSVEESLKDMLHLACLRHLCILLLQVCIFRENIV